MITSSSEGKGANSGSVYVFLDEAGDDRRPTLRRWASEQAGARARIEREVEARQGRDERDMTGMEKMEGSTERARDWHGGGAEEDRW